MARPDRGREPLMKLMTRNRTTATMPPRSVYLKFESLWTPTGKYAQRKARPHKCGVPCRLSRSANASDG